MTLLAEPLLSARSFSPPLASLGFVAFWSNLPEPNAAYYNGKTYITGVRDTGHIYVAEYVHSTGLLSTPYDIGSSASPDGVIHNAPCILVRSSDHRIVVFFAEDNTAQAPRIFVSTNPEDATSFGAHQDLGPAVNAATYPCIYQLAGGAIYAFVRIQDAAPNFHTGFYKSTDGGATWSSWQALIGPISTTSQYYRIGSDGTRIDIFTTDTNRVAAAASVYHMYLDSSDNLRKSDGTLIGAASGGPYIATAGTLVQDASLGTARPEGGWAYDGSGHPYVVVLCYDSVNVRDDVRVCRWTGSAWTCVTIANSGGLPSTFKFDHGAAIAIDDPTQVFIPIKVGGHFELFKYFSTDQWATWSSAQLTFGSAEDFLEPRWVLNGAAGCRMVVPYGTLTDGTNFDFTLYRWTR